MIHPRYWARFAWVRWSARNYPLYDVPHKRWEKELAEPEVQENFSYFMSVRMARLAFFREWLRSHFWVDASLDGAGLRAVSRWGDAYSGGLIDGRQNILGIYQSYQPRWERRYVGFNVMIDIGIFLGEYLIAKQPRLYWEIYRGHDIEPASFNSPGFQKPCLGGMPSLQKPSPLSDGRGLVANSRDLADIFDRTAWRGSLVTGAKSVLFYSKSDTFEDPLNPGDYHNEPI